jgi:hypothetical protein
MSGGYLCTESCSAAFSILAPNLENQPAFIAHHPDLFCTPRSLILPMSSFSLLVAAARVMPLTHEHTRPLSLSLFSFFFGVTVAPTANDRNRDLHPDKPPLATMDAKRCVVRRCRPL